MAGFRDGLFFDDVMILPRHSEVTASSVTLETRLSDSVLLHVPFLSSARQPSADYRLALAVARAGGMGIIPPGATIEDQAHEVRKVKEFVCSDPGAACDAKGRPAVGAVIDVEQEGVLERIGMLAEVWTDIIVVDVPHADRLSILQQIRMIKAEYDWMPLMVGSVETRAGAKDVIDAGADIVLVGRGSSSLAEATELSGVGVPELSALMEAEDVASLYGKPVVCNLGVETAASAVKALAAGAGAVVLHKLTPETAEDAMRSMRRQLSESLSYVGAQTIAELREKAEFVRIHPRGV